MIVRSIILIAAAVCATNSFAGEKKIVAGTWSPDRTTAIVEERNPENGGRDYYFAAQPNGGKLGDILEPDENDISNVAILASWNPRADKVALLIFHGTKMNRVKLCAKNPAGNFVALKLQPPDANQLYQIQGLPAIPREGDGHNENAIGRWKDDDAVELISGFARQTNDPNHSTHVLVSYVARADGGNVILSEIQLHGPLTDEQSETFIKKWGEQYFVVEEQ
jgi:hypothetical protein